MLNRKTFFFFLENFISLEWDIRSVKKLKGYRNFYNMNRICNILVIRSIIILLC